MTKSRDLNLIYLISFMDLFAVGLTVPLFSNHLRELGASHFTIGLLNSLYSGLQVFTGPVVGSWSDVRDRKSVLAVSLVLSGVCYVVLGCTESLLVIALLRFMLGVTKHTQTLVKALIMDLLPASERSSALGKSTALGSLGFIVGPTLGGHLSEFEHGFSYVCYVTGLLFAINIGFAYLLADVTSWRSAVFGTFEQELQKSMRELKDIDWGSLWETFVLRFIFGFSANLYFSQQSMYLREQFDLSQRHVGYTISYFNATSVLSAFLLHHITVRFYEDDESCLRRISHFFVSMTISSLCLYAAPNIGVFLLVLIPYSLSSTVLRIVSMELMLKKAASTQRGSLSGASNSIMSIARFVTPVSAGLISDKLGGHSAMLFSAFPPLMGAAVALRLRFKGGRVNGEGNEDKKRK